MDALAGVYAWLDGCMNGGGSSLFVSRGPKCFRDTRSLPLQTLSGFLRCEKKETS